MYKSYFELDRAPFAAMPDPACFVSQSGVQTALEQSLSCLRSGQGLVVLTGAAGTGKSLLCRKLLDEMGDSFAGVFLPHSNFPTRRAFLQAVLYELGQPYIRLSAQELRLELKTAVRSIRPRHEAVLLIADEAHLLSDRLLEEIRTMTTLVPADQPLVRVLLSGQLSLEEKLFQPTLDALNQQVRCQVALERLTLRESARYISARLAWAGGDASLLFTDEALRAVCHASDGLPRCLNQLADHSLQLACSSGRPTVDLAIVRQALDDLRQLPLHWNDLSGVFGAGESDAESVRECDSIAGSAVDETPATSSFSPCHDDCNQSEPDDLKSTVEVIEVGAADDEPVADRSLPDTKADITEPIGVVSIDEFTATEEHLVGFEANSTSPVDRSESVVIGPSAEFQHIDAEPEPQTIHSQPVNDAIRSVELLGARPVVQDIGEPQPKLATRTISANCDATNGSSRFAEEPVLDRYAFLDAGLRLPCEFFDGRARETQTSSDDPFLNLDAESICELQPTTPICGSDVQAESDIRDVDENASETPEVAVSEPVMRMLGDDSLWDAKPDELIDRLLPLLDELIDPSPPADADIDADGIRLDAAEGLEMLGGETAGPHDLLANAADNQSLWSEGVGDAAAELDRSIHQLLTEAGQLLLEADLPPDVDALVDREQLHATQAGQYDVVQPESRQRSDAEAASEHRPYSQLFSQLRRRHPSSS